MTTLRPERPADGPMSYDTGQFEQVVGQLDDPLNDPLPGRSAAAPGDHRAAGPDPAAAPGPSGPPAAGPTSPWFRDPGMHHQAPPAPPQDFVHPGPVVPEGFLRPEPAAPDAYLRPEPAAGQDFVRPEPAGVDETARLPVVEERADQRAGGGEAARDAEDGQPQEPGADTALPGDGGRAARRKAAAKGGGGGHRARGRTPGAAAAAAEASAPLSRVEARRAQRAAKESPAVVASRFVGELFITIGVLMLLFVTYQLWWTNVRAHAQADRASNKLEQQWNTDQKDPNRVPGTFTPGQGFAIMYIPKLDVKAPIAQGVSKTHVLDKGMIGHYDGALNTAMPWDKTGNFAVAAHRNTHGEPFRYINRLVPGDKVVVETSTTYYTYQVTSSLASTPPSNIGVLQPVPIGSGYTKPGRYLTLTTCTPEFTSTNRLIVWGTLIEQRPRSKGKPDALANG